MLPIHLSVYHVIQHGYVIVEISGEGLDDYDAALTRKERTFDSLSSSYKYLPTSKSITYTAEGSTGIKKKGDCVKVSAMTLDLLHN